jgi:hypothetical protein
LLAIVVCEFCTRRSARASRISVGVWCRGLIGENRECVCVCVGYRQIVSDCQDRNEKVREAAWDVIETCALELCRANRGARRCVCGACAHLLRLILWKLRRLTWRHFGKSVSFLVNIVLARRRFLVSEKCSVGTESVDSGQIDVGIRQEAVLFSVRDSDIVIGSGH